MLLNALAAFRLFQNEPCCPEIPFLDALQGVTPGVNALITPEVDNVPTDRLTDSYRFMYFGVTWTSYFIYKTILMGLFEQY